MRALLSPLSALLVLAAGCHANVMPTAPDGGTAATRQFRLDSLAFDDGGDPALDYDLDGDGKPDNRIGRLFEAIRAQLEIDFPALLRAGLAPAGRPILVDLPPPSDSGPVVLFAGLPADPNAPSTPFVVDRITPPTVLSSAAAQAGEFQAMAGGLSPALLLMFVAPAQREDLTLVLPLRVHHARFDRTDATHIAGRLHGSVWQADIEGFFGSRLAEFVNARIASAPDGRDLLARLDRGDGKGGTCEGPAFLRPPQPRGVPGDGLVAPCEIVPLLGADAQPDIHVWDASTFHPAPPPAKPDSISFLLRVTGIAAAFQ